MKWVTLVLSVLDELLAFILDECHETDKFGLRYFFLTEMDNLFDSWLLLVLYLSGILYI